MGIRAQLSDKQFDGTIKMIRTYDNSLEENLRDNIETLFQEIVQH